MSKHYDKASLALHYNCSKYCQVVLFMLQYSSPDSYRSSYLIQKIIINYSRYSKTLSLFKIPLKSFQRPEIKILTSLICTYLPTRISITVENTIKRANPNKPNEFICIIKIINIIMIQIYEDQGRLNHKMHVRDLDINQITIKECTNNIVSLDTCMKLTNKVCR